MIKNINFRGINLLGSDYDVPDGTLLAASNVIPTTAGLRTPVVPTKINDLIQSDEEKVIYLHRTHEFTHYIIQTYNDTTASYSLRYIKENDNFARHDVTGFSIPDPIENITSINNTLILTTGGRGLVYMYYKEGQGYILLDKIPELPIRFSLDCRLEKEKSFTVHPVKSTKEGEENKVVLEDGEELMVKGNINKFIADYSLKLGRFIFPFLVRYAYRMYDGTLTKQSAPILMLTSDLVTPCICGDNFDLNGPVQLNISAATHKLFYQCVDVDLRQLDVWSDIIKSVDIFITKPIYTYDQEGDLIISQNAEEAKTPYAMKSVSICHMDEAGIRATSNLPLIRNRNYNQPRIYRDMYLLTYRKINYPGGQIPGDTTWTNLINDLEEVIKVPAIKAENLTKRIKEEQVFYKLKSIPISDLSYVRTDVKVPENYLQSLVAREVMTDDYDSHCELYPETMFAYNNRLNIANITKYLFSGYNPSTSLQATDGYLHLSVDNDGYVYNHNITDKMSLTVYIYLKKNGNDVILRTPVSGHVFGYCTPVFFYYYPDPDAYKAVFCFKSQADGTVRKMTLELTPHDFLNGAVFCDTPSLERDFFYYYDTLTNGPIIDAQTDGPSFHADEYARWIERAVTNGNIPDYSAEPEEKGERSVQLPNKIYTSIVNNPFSFPLIDINTVGSGEILGLASVTKPLSEGQVGDFPLCAFTTQGIWALTVNPNTGTYSSVQAIVRDVCINKNAIVSTDSALLFFTSRGLMLLSGAKVTCLSEELEGKTPHAKMNDIYPFEELSSKFDVDIPQFTFLNYIKYGGEQNAGILYDYIKRRIFVFNKQCNFVYIYDIETEQWGTMAKNIQYGINSFPEAIAVTKDDTEHLDNFSDAEHRTRNIFLLTRPLKLDMRDIYKTVRTAIMRGRLSRSRLGQILFGSNDLTHWFPVADTMSSDLRNISGTPYKYFSIGILGELVADESISAMDIEVIEKLYNKLR